MSACYLHNLTIILFGISNVSGFTILQIWMVHIIYIYIYIYMDIRIIKFIFNLLNHFKQLNLWCWKHIKIHGTSTSRLASTRSWKLNFWVNSWSVFLMLVFINTEACGVGLRVALQHDGTTTRLVIKELEAGGSASRAIPPLHVGDILTAGRCRRWTWIELGQCMGVRAHCPLIPPQARRAHTVSDPRSSGMLPPKPTCSQGEPRARTRGPGPHDLVGHDPRLPSDGDRTGIRPRQGTGLG